MMSGGAVSNQAGSIVRSDGGNLEGPSMSGQTGSMVTPQAPRPNLAALQQTPSAGGMLASARKGFFTPGRSGASHSIAASTPQRTGPGRRDLGAGALHLWNVQHNTPGTAARTNSDSLATADVRPRVVVLERCARPCCAILRAV